MYLGIVGTVFFFDSWTDALRVMEQYRRDHEEWEKQHEEWIRRNPNVIPKFEFSPTASNEINYMCFQMGVFAQQERLMANNRIER